jgi:hypothetical protein
MFRFQIKTCPGIGFYIIMSTDAIQIFLPFIVFEWVGQDILETLDEDDKETP